MNDYTQLIETALTEYLPKDEDISGLVKAMQYSLMAGGKRIRPTLTLEFCNLCGADTKNALPFACAVEMIHTYSLIHDDLPCMDNDDMRRGKPSNHCVFGEDNALLAGDSLLTLAFEAVLSQNAEELCGAKAAAKAGRTLAYYAGVCGMAGGQFIDLGIEGKKVSVEVLKNMCLKKTGALIAAACELGCIAAGASDEQIKQAGGFGKKIGLVFQIVDDILDVTSTTDELGKPVLSDIGNGKNTFMSLLGEEKCRQLAEKLTVEATDALSAFDSDRAKPLNDLAYSLLKREK